MAVALGLVPGLALLMPYHLSQEVLFALCLGQGLVAN